MTQANNNIEQQINISRRKTLGTLSAFSVLGATSLIGCGGGSGKNNSSFVSAISSSSSSTSSVAAATSSAATSNAAGACVLTPSDEIGPFPLSTVLNSSTILREAVNEDKTGVPLTLKLKLVNVNNSCSPVSGYIYIWHCDKDGLYSGYSQTNNAGQAGKTYCRGVQYTDADGVATFTTIYPGWYEGRVTHIHFQVFLTSYSNTAQATEISQMAFPDAITTAVYKSALYSKGQNTSVRSNSADHVFSDGYTYQLLTMTGNLDEGYVGELQIGLNI